MRHRGNLSKEERALRSQSAKLVHQKPFVYGSIVTSKRKCGKVNCWCKKDKKDGHLSSYLSVRVGNKRKMVFIPQTQLAKAKQWTQAYKEINGYILKISERCLDRLNEA